MDSYTKTMMMKMSLMNFLLVTDLREFSLLRFNFLSSSFFKCVFRFALGVSAPTFAYARPILSKLISDYYTLELA